MTSVCVCWFHVPVQPDRCPVPSVIDAPLNEPSLWMGVVPFKPMLLAPLLTYASVMVHWFCVMHSLPLVAVSPQPAPLSASEYMPDSVGHASPPSGFVDTSAPVPESFCVVPLSPPSELPPPSSSPVLAAPPHATATVGTTNQ
jgi:hypothetical protein